MATAAVADDPGAALAAALDLLDAEPARAAAIATEIIDREPDNLPALHLLARALRNMDQPALAGRLDQRAVNIAAKRPALIDAIRHFGAGRLRTAERVVRRSLADDPDDVASLCLLAEIARRAGLPGEAEKLLRRSLALAPGFDEARVNLAKLLFQRGDAGGALALLDTVLEADPDDAAALAAKLAILVQAGDYTPAIACYEQALGRRGRDARLWTDYAHVLTTVGRIEESALAFRAALAIDHALGEAWLGLANFHFASLNASDIAAMESALAATSTGDDRQIALHFALGRVLEEAGRHEAAFARYCSGNWLQRRRLRYDPDITTDEVQRSIAYFTPDRLHAWADSGADSTAPIFVIGMPRSGSSLVEQILASHHAVEGLSECPNIPRLIMNVLARSQRQDATFPEILDTCSQDDLRSLGEAYLRGIAARRRTRRPFFVDKLPNNWAFIGFIQLILPNARIIDVRREREPCCFSNFAQHFPRRQGFSNDLGDTRRYYDDYVRLLDHFDTVAPGRIMRVRYEALVARPDAAIRSLLSGIGLPFDPECLRFYENHRPVSTASAAAVRRPINSHGIDRWRPFAAYLNEPGFEPIADAQLKENSISIGII